MILVLKDFSCCFQPGIYGHNQTRIKGLYTKLGGKPQLKKKKMYYAKIQDLFSLYEGTAFCIPEKVGDLTANNKNKIYELLITVLEE